MLELLFCVGLVALCRGFDGNGRFLVYDVIGCFAGLGYGLADFGGFAGGWISGGLLEFGFGGGLWFLFGFGGCAFADWLFVVGWCGCDGLVAVACGLLVLDFVLGV